MSGQKQPVKPPVSIPPKPLEAENSKPTNFSFPGEVVIGNEKAPSINTEIRARSVPVPPQAPPNPPKK